MFQLDPAEAADSRRQFGDRDGCVQAPGVELVQHALDSRQVLSGQCTLEPALRAVAERVEQRAAQILANGEHPHRAPHPCTESLLRWFARVGAALPWQCQMKLHPVAALEARRQGSIEIGAAEQACDFVLVLVGEQAERLARHGIGEPLALGRNLVFSAAHALHQCHITARHGLVLVGDEFGAAPRDHLVEVARKFARRRRGFGGGGLARGLLRLRGGATAPVKGALVVLHRNTVQLDCALQRRVPQRHEPALPGKAEHEEVACDRMADKQRGEPCRIQFVGREHRLVQQGQQRFARVPLLGVANEVAADQFGRVQHGAGAVTAHALQGVGAGRNQQVAAEQHIGALNPQRVQRLGRGSDAHMGEHSAAFLRHARVVEHAHALALKKRSGAEQGAQRHDAATADSGDEQRIRLYQRGQRRLGQCRSVHRQPLGLLQCRCLNRDQRRTAALQTGQIEVAGVGIDRAFLAEFGVHRHDRQTVGLEAAVAAALAQGFVDEDMARRCGQGTAAAPAPHFGGTGLVVDEHADPMRQAQLTLHRVELFARAHLHARGEDRLAWVLVRVVGEHDDARHTLGSDLARQLRHAQVAVHRLPAGHRDGVVVEQLVGDVDVCRYRGADRQQPGVEVRAVAHVGEHMRRAGVFGHADPGCAFAAHLADRQGAALHRHRHQVTADTAEGARTFRNLRRAVVRAARAEVRGALRQWRRCRG